MNTIFNPIAAGMTDIGLVRSTNQDSYLINQQIGLFMVADGMGGHAGGEIASKYCIDVVQQEILENIHRVNSEGTLQDIKEKMNQAVNRASGCIYDKALEEPHLRGMGTTATLLKVYRDTGVIGHVGDSRLYLIRNNFMYQLTSDHSLVSERVAAGKLTEEEAVDHHLQNVITRCVGFQVNEYVDVIDFQIHNKDLVIICSDGLHGKVSDKEISNITSKHRLDSVDKLVDLAKQRGGDDNITVVIIDFHTKLYK